MVLQVAPFLARTSPCRLCATMIRLLLDTCPFADGVISPALARCPPPRALRTPAAAARCCSVLLVARSAASPLEPKSLGDATPPPCDCRRFRGASSWAQARRSSRVCCEPLAVSRRSEHEGGSSARHGPRLARLPGRAEDGSSRHREQTTFHCSANVTNNSLAKKQPNLTRRLYRRNTMQLTIVPDVVKGGARETPSPIGQEPERAQGGQSSRCFCVTFLDRGP
jgi:hypothetical protein